MDCCWTSASLVGWLPQPYSVLCTSRRTSPRTSPYLGRSPLVCFACRWLRSLSPAVGFALLLPDFGFALLGSFHRFSPSRRLSAALRAHRRFDVLLAVLVPVLLHFVLLFTTGSLAVVLSRILTTCSLAVAPSVFFSHHWLCGSGSVSDPLQRHFVVVYRFLDASLAPPAPPLSIAPFEIVGSR